MKITKIDTHLVNMGHRNIPYVIVHTDEGIHGVGEPYSCGPDKATVEAIHDFEEWLIGRDPRDIEGLWHLMYAGSRFPGGSVVNAAISGIEHALWDIAGKAAGLPVYRLLGGKCRERIRVYQAPRGTHARRTGRQRRRAHREVWLHRASRWGRCRSTGRPCRGTKPCARPNAASARCARPSARTSTSAWTPMRASSRSGRAVELCQVVAPFRPFFVEEPLRPENYEAMQRLSELVTVPLATGEMLYTRYEFRDLINTGAVSIVQPDICLTGGLWEMKKIASMAEANYMSVAPHNPCGPVATAVNVHFAASTTNFVILEYHADDEGARRDIVDEPMKLVDGYLELPDKPGLGIDLDLDAMARYPFSSWHRPFTLPQRRFARLSITPPNKIPGDDPDYRIVAGDVRSFNWGKRLDRSTSYPRVSSGITSLANNSVPSGFGKSTARTMM